MGTHEQTSTEHAHNNIYQPRPPQGASDNDRGLKMTNS